MIKDYLSQFGEEKVNSLERLIAEIEQWNKKINLVSFRDRRELVLKHVLDSAYLLEFVDLHGRVLDVGTGGGFPGLVLAILQPSVEFILMDATGKKIEVLKQIVSVLGLKNVSFEVGRAEELAHETSLRSAFEIVIARAVAKMPVLLELGAGFVKEGGFFIAYKGRDYLGEMELAEAAAAILGMRFEERFEYSLPEGMGERVLLVYRKEGELPKEYPRRVGMPTKKPLGMT